MFFNKDTFSNNPFMSKCSIGTQFGQMDISNMIIDELVINEGLDEIENIEKEDWKINTDFQALFQNTLEGGNLTNNGVRIQKIRFKKRENNSLTWTVMTEVPYKQEQVNYEIKDYYVKAYENIEYAVSGLTQNIESKGVSQIIQSKYMSMYLTGKDENDKLYNYPLRFDLSVSDISTNESKVFQQTLCSQYPILLSGKTKYQSGSLSVTLISPTTEEQNGEIDMQAENSYREGFEKFIGLGKPLLIRYHSLYLFGIITEPKKKPFSDDCAFGIWNYTLTFTEINNTNTDTLIKYGLTYDVEEITS